jgi:hypothetical protein
VAGALKMLLRVSARPQIPDREPSNGQAVVSFLGGDEGSCGNYLPAGEASCISSRILALVPAGLSLTCGRHAALASAAGVEREQGISSGTLENFSPSDLAMRTRDIAS